MNGGQRGGASRTDGEDAWLSAWAKSFYESQVGVTHWLPLVQHLDDSGAIAERLVDRWLPRQVIQRLAEDLPGGEADVSVVARWLASVHDVGKASPAFAVQVPILADRMRSYGLIAPLEAALDPMRSRITHSLVGHVAVREWLSNHMGFPYRGAAAQFASVVGSHHGIAPERDQLVDVDNFKHLAGTGSWEIARDRVLEHTTAQVGGRQELTRFREVHLSRPSQVLLTGIIIMADWIASNADLFPLEPIATAELSPAAPDENETTRRAEAAWEELDLPPRWSPLALGPDVDAELHARFPHITSARPVQVEAIRTAQAQREPEILVIEAPMGVGKTEAALVAAEVLANSSGAGGCFIALPTQSTTDAMFTRVGRWLRALPRGADGAALDVSLAHGKASLNDEFEGLVRAGRFACVGDDGDDSITVHQWLRGSKKGPLASFVVGTIDQILIAGLKSRHVMLRHLALAGKVIVIDEVHAYDVYMSQYLQRVLHWLGAYRVPVVLLSATLPAARRAELLQAYASGRGEEVSVATDDALGYPVIVSSAEMTPRVVAEPSAVVEVRLDHLPDDLDTLVSYLRKHLADGGCAAVVRNTVTRVQETADRLVLEFGDENITVNHSRFLSCDRARIDSGLVRRFGPPGPDNDRRGPHIVVASQVLEQSLDVDFDLLVTDLAPADLILQRMGRMHRHRRERPEAVSAPRCALVGVQDWNGNPARAVAGSRRVYGEHTLLRAAALLLDRNAISLPTDIAPLVQAAYGSADLGPQSWQESMIHAARAEAINSAERKDRARQFLLGAAGESGSLVGWLRAGVGDADGVTGAAQVRDGAESLEVLVVQRDQDGGLLTPEWIARGGGMQVPLDQAVPGALARVIAACSLRLPLALSHERVLDSVIAALEANCFSSFAQSPLLAGHLVLVLNDKRQATLTAGDDKFLLTYDTRRGLIHECQ